jgi:phage terminase small subunit
MTELTPQQEQFAQCVADGMNQSDAYRAAFNIKPTTLAKTVNEAASRMMANTKVRARVQELRDKLEEERLWKRIDSVRTLSEIARGHDELAKPSDRVAAVKELNTMHGWNSPSKLELTGANGGPVEMAVLDAEAYKKARKAALDADDC